MKTGNKNERGFTLSEIMIVVGLISLLVTLAFPSFIKARTESNMRTCISNLHVIQGAVHTWALEAKRGAASPVTHADIVGYMRYAPVCPSGGKAFDTSYTLTTVQVNPACALVGTHILPPDQN